MAKTRVIKISVHTVPTFCKMKKMADVNPSLGEGEEAIAKENKE